MAFFLVIAVRILVPFSILRWPFGGVLLSIAADATDVIILDALGWGSLDWKFYHPLDKLFDIYYLSFAFYVSLKWQEKLARNTSIILFLWRFAGFVVFEITGIRKVLFFAPNIFENFYLLAAGAKKFFPNFRLDNHRKLAIFLLIAAIPKIIQEYIQHFQEFPIWPFIKHNIFRWK